MTTIATTSDAAAPRRPSHDDYQPMLDALHRSFKTASSTGVRLFRTDATNLWEAYLDSLPADERQSHNCNACRHFVERFGGLVTIDAGGTTRSAMFDEGDETIGIYQASFANLRAIVLKARVMGVFLSSQVMWGVPSNRTASGDRTWYHMAVSPPAGMLFKSSLKTDGQVMAEKLEDYRMLCHALAEFSADTVKQASAIADSEALYRGEKVAGHLRWLAQLQEARAATRGLARDNVTWLAVANAPAGWCHIRSSMIGTLLEDVAAGLEFETIKRRFAEKMAPDQYRRPTAAPSDGAIAQAEKIVAALNTAGSLRRRFAKLDDIQHALWKPVVPSTPTAPNGVFGHLMSKRAAAHPVIQAPPITWEKFQRTVLGDACSMEILVPDRHGGFIALVTAADPAAPPILQWDSDAHRNPVSWYLYAHGSLASAWGLAGGTFAKVSLVTNMPFMWPGSIDNGNHGAGAIFIIEGAKDSRQAGSALFPEILRSEYHGVRSVLERYSRGAELEGRDEASACGLEIRKGGTGPTVRVTASTGAVTEYKIDRWD